TVRIDAGDGAGRVRKQRLAAPQLVGVIDAYARLAGDAGCQRQLIVEARGGAVVHRDLHHDEEQPGFFEFGVGVAEVAEELDSAHLEILQEDAMMEHPHGVAFGVTHAERHRVLMRYVVEWYSRKRTFGSVA